RSVVVGQGAHQFDDPAPHLGVADAGEGAVEQEALRARQEVDAIGRLAVLGEALLRRPPRRALEEVGDGNLEDRGDGLEAAGADAVGALLVFLDLLEGDAEMLAELFLTHADHVAPQADAATDMDVDRIRLLLALGHRSSPSSAGNPPDRPPAVVAAGVPRDSQRSE